MSQQGFTGIAFPFRFSGGGGVAKSTTSEDDFSHIREEIIQLLCTNMGERVFRPSFGSEVHRTTYDNNDITTSALMRSYVEDALVSLSDIIEIMNIDIVGDDEGLDGAVYIYVDVFVKKYLKNDTVVVPYNTGGVR